MRKTNTLIYLVVAALVLAGCTVSYSGTPVSTQQHGATSPADATMNAIRSAFFTQTAQAHLQNGETPAPAQGHSPEDQRRPDQEVPRDVEAEVDQAQPPP